MMPPAWIDSPPNALTPRRLECESRPLRELPPAFLCAIAVCPVVAASADDAVDLQLGVTLTVTLVLLVMLAPAHLEDLQLLAAPMAKDRRFDRRACDGRLTQTDARPVPDQ